MKCIIYPPISRRYRGGWPLCSCEGELKSRQFLLAVTPLNLSGSILFMLYKLAQVYNKLKQAIEDPYESYPLISLNLKKLPPIVLKKQQTHWLMLHRFYFMKAIPNIACKMKTCITAMSWLLGCSVLTPNTNKKCCNFFPALGRLG